MVLHKGLPVYIVDFDENSTWEHVAMVDSPAIQIPFIHFSKESEIRFSIDEEKRVVTGPVLIPDQLIYRYTDDGGFYLKFTKDVIEQYAIDFFRNSKQTEGNVEHQVSVDGLTFYESYLVNHSRNIAPMEFDLPDGTWIMSAKVENDEVWDAIKDGTLNGFSIGLRSRIEPEKDEIDNLDDFVNWLNEQ